MPWLPTTARRSIPSTIAEALQWFDARLGKEELDKTILAFIERFPTADVYRKEKTPEEWLAGQTDGISHRAVAFEEMMLLWLANANPAFKPFSELFTDQSLAAVTRYQLITAGLRDYFSTRPPLATKNKSMNLIDTLRAPALASPDSLSGQLAYIVEHWADLIGDVLAKLLLAIDVLKEEDVAIWMRFHPPDARVGRKNFPWTTDQQGVVPSFAEATQESERFSPDQEWMPTTVLIAKSTYVWLEQLSRFYGRHIHRLDQIPDEELRRLAAHGINSLWLIGLWERSLASQTHQATVRQPRRGRLCLLAVRYHIAADLGGEPAYTHLRDRACAARRSAGQRHGAQSHGHRFELGHRTSRLVHVSPWTSPFPSYRFEGPDLSRDGRVGILLEDHYYAQSDAAVVFRRRDKWTGDTRYIYHGNDGTSMPWNDTAQLELPQPRGARGGHPDHSARGPQVSHHPFRRRHDAGQETLPAALVPRARHRRSHSVARGARPEQGGQFDARHAGGVLARSGRPRRSRSSRHSVAGRGVLADGGLLRPHARHAPRLQQRLHEHAEATRRTPTTAAS